jgi:diguanylate cyclase (GGDEF)-like protein
MPSAAIDNPASVLVAMIQMLLAAEGLDDVRAAIAHGARKISTADTLSLYEVQSSATLEMVLRRGEQLGAGAHAVEDMLCGKAAKTSRTVSTLDRFVDEQEQFVADEYTCSGRLCLTRSLHAYGEFIGLVVFHYSSRAALHESEFDALRRFVDCAAAALSNARTRDDLRNFAYTDALTGLANRRRLEAEFGRLDGTKLSLLLIDFDGLKAVNDTLGYERGDALISTVGVKLAASANPGELVARLGGDEFVVIMSGMSGSAARARAEEMTAILDRLDLPEDLARLFHGASVGSATAEPGEDSWDVLRRASTEMRSRKRRRKTDRESTSGQAPEGQALDRRYERRRDI